MKHVCIALSGILLLAASVGCSERTVQQRSSSMAPTIQQNEVIRLDASAYRKVEPSRWDVIVFHPTPLPDVGSDALFAMRVVGLPGEVVELREDGAYIDGALLEMPEQIAHIRYLPVVLGDSAGISYPFHIPADSYFVLGDNTMNAYDSRFWGAVPRQSIIGKVRNK